MREDGAADPSGTESSSIASGELDAGKWAQRLVDWFHEAIAESCVIALSGGVDSAVVAQAAQLSRVSAVAVTAISPSISSRERVDAQQVAEFIGIAHHALDTQEIDRPDYSRNDQRRCYFCKSELFARIQAEFPAATIVTGTNHDDLQDYRPGLQAAKEFCVRAPLAELGVGKQQVRRLAEYWNLPVADKPASPCLASRIAYGVPVTPERLARVEGAEQVLRELGLHEFRVRLHADEMARIEVPEAALPRIVAVETRRDLVQRLTQLGFSFVTLDLQGFRSGSLNALVQIGDKRA
ncbi:MAG: ATP-dependent sacrificial sulfur transferase LarE [bacterium]|nr:ATP-dependent sacrificial sulfur transferase LarE [bacterium]